MVSAFLVGSLFAVEPSVASKLSLSNTIAFESQYMFRGHGIADHSIQASVAGNYELFKGSLYGNVWTGVPVGNNASSFAHEVDFTIGYKLPMSEKYTLDFGCFHYWYPDNTAGAVANRTNEFYAGVSYNGFCINPAAYLYYDINLETITGELSAGYGWDLTKVGFQKTTLDLLGSLGAVSANDADGDQIDGKTHNGYMYYCLTADVTYHFNDDSLAAVGVRYAGNNDNQATGNAVYDREDNIWWGMKFTVGF